ncbi:MULTISPECIES: hypothetical protein [Pseudonocardia]|uniref:hypothetical protein n=1 Tax=Pseudonocardia TaxID=1847 RepID=UPI001F18157D|nr:hypothetical protein [Pseudonocardia sp. WMMC193]MCF7547189.1 hypothetical protein [Pseudonocardia sp. WMMC193]
MSEYLSPAAAEKHLLVAAAAELRHLAQQGAYAGLRGRDVGFSFAAALDCLVQGRDPRRDLVKGAERLVYGPDGPNDPRASRSKGLGNY